MVRGVVARPGGRGAGRADGRAVPRAVLHFPGGKRSRVYRPDRRQCVRYAGGTPPGTARVGFHGPRGRDRPFPRSEEHTSELQSLRHIAGRHRDLPSFPPRRSSDLIAVNACDTRAELLLGRRAWDFMDPAAVTDPSRDRKSTRLNSSHLGISRAATEIYLLSLHDALPI